MRFLVPFSAASDEISVAACDNDPKRLELVGLYGEVIHSIHDLLFPYSEGSPCKLRWVGSSFMAYICMNCFSLCCQMCKMVEANSIKLVQTSSAKELAEMDAVRNFLRIETICEDMLRILTPLQPSHPTEEKPSSVPENKPEAASTESEVAVCQDDCKPISLGSEGKDVVMESELEKESSTTDVVKEKETPISTIETEGKGNDVEMDEATTVSELNEKTEKSDKGVILLDD